MDKMYIDIGQVWMIEQENDPSKWKKGTIAKTRPMLVVGVHGASTNCIPITSSEVSKEYNKIYHQLQNGDILLLTQIRTISREEYIQYMYTVTNEEFRRINQKIIDMFAKPNQSNWYRPISRKSNKSKPKRPEIDKDYTVETLPDAVKDYIISHYTEEPMYQLLSHFSYYALTKSQVYQIILQHTL